MKKRKKNSFRSKQTIKTFIFILIILIGLFFITPSIETWYQESSFELDISVVVAALGVLVTGIICWLTAASVREVSRSNKENRAYNSVKEQKDSFEKQFTILLQEHHNYLSKLLASDNKLYKPDYLLSLKGFEALSIIRGTAKRITTPNYTFVVKDDETLIKLNRWTNGEKTWFFPSKELIKNEELTEQLNNEIFISRSGTLYGLTKYDTFYDISSLGALSPEHLADKLDNVFKAFDYEVIKRSNAVSKNILSPYMRIVYHILKLANNNTGSVKEMKQYTNIIRSIIPNDILILIAINAMFFYRNHTDTINNSYRWFDFNFDNLSMKSELTNDYYKYYNLLIKCDFF
ncbi:putative phage abortive infection protein [Providencia sp. PROV132]|uniref:putative phage abortive infection protein n=1 Tax=Providencia sp. PROV132 TaxID=2949842 RepID=UPI00234B5DD4|nr:putative phage abortive infection protein [Providencia sp. PROV132]